MAASRSTIAKDVLVSPPIYNPSPTIQWQKPKKEKEPFNLFDFFICFFSFFALLLNHLFGMMAIVCFIAPWALVFLRNRNLAIRAIIINWPMLLLPAFAALSTIWSDDPKWTLKASIELGLTAIIGILAGGRLQPRSLITGLLTALLFIAFASLPNIQQVMYASSVDQYINGVFGSKNQFSMAMSLLFLVAIVVVTEKSHTMFFRLLAFFTCLFAPLLLYIGNSVGAILAVIMACTVYAVTQRIKRFPKGLRILSLTAICSFIFTIMIISALPL